ncbi:MAG: hypothetical protein HY268_00645 [Deltaproteobacteria bacterium]|nr:hypothetical protein [Deltaproteobacteria bacterium]
MCYIPAMSSPTSSSQTGLLSTLGKIFRGFGTAVRKMPILVVFIVVAAVLSYRQFHQPAEEQVPQFNGPEEMSGETPPPADLPAGTNPSLWTCVHRVDSQLSNGLWADIYFGMEVQLDGKVVTVKVTEKWKELSDDKRKTVAQLVVDTWLENGRALHLLNTDEEPDEIVIKRLPDDETVAAWKPATGVQLFAPQVGA